MNPKILLTACVSLCVFALVMVMYIPTALNRAPTQFPLSTTITITEGMPLREITHFLKEKNIVRSSLYLHFILSHTYEDTFVQAGMYFFEHPQTTKEVARMLTSGMQTEPLLKVTFPEGFSAYDIARYIPSSLAPLDTNSFTTHEGYLFPDTYFISPNASIDELIKLMQTTFDKKMNEVAEKIDNSGLSNDEVVILASIIEREAKDADSKKLVAGILLNRLKIDMPLQVDAAFTYILDKTSAELTAEDLAIDSPYNTYIHTGLPPTPISNPGMDSILAVLEPTQTDYLYYLTDDSGTFHYAETFEKHKLNKSTYLQ